MKRVTVYVTSWCPYCNSAKALLSRLNIPYDIVDLTDQDELRQELVAKTGWRTVPMIYFEDELIGGFQELRALEQQGTLFSKLA